jgi:hypothetical protein
MHINFSFSVFRFIKHQIKKRHNQRISNGSGSGSGSGSGVKKRDKGFIRGLFESMGNLFTSNSVNVTVKKPIKQDQEEAAAVDRKYLKNPSGSIHNNIVKSVSFAHSNIQMDNIKQNVIVDSIHVERD